jgi:heme oxygenase
MAHADAPPGAAFGAPDDPASIAGVIYVLEGTRIGGNILAKRIGGGLPCSCLSSPCDAQSWRRTLSRLDDFICDAETRMAAAKAALSVFARLENAGQFVKSFEDEGPSRVSTDPSVDLSNCDCEPTRRHPTFRFSVWRPMTTG